MSTKHMVSSGFWPWLLPYTTASGIYIEIDIYITAFCNNPSLSSTCFLGQAAPDALVALCSAGIPCILIATSRLLKNK